MKRRSLLLSGATVAGGLLVGWGMLPPRSRLGHSDDWSVAAGEVALNGWIKIRPDGSAVLAMNRSEMGQGIHTALAMLVAEELNLSLAQVHLETAGPQRLYGNVAMFLGSLPLHLRDKQAGHETMTVRASEWLMRKLARELGINVTGGSSSMKDAWEVLRWAAATARAQLLGAASLAWRVPVDELQVVQGVVSHATGDRAHYGTLVLQAARTPPGTVELKPRHDWTLIGQPAPRTDLPAKVTGQARYGMDVRLPDLCFAVMRHCPMLGGSPGAIDTTETMRCPGVERVVRLGAHAGATAGVAVVGRSSWHAKQGADALRIEWQAPPQGMVDSERIQALLVSQARSAIEQEGGWAFTRRGDWKAASQAHPSRLVESTYGVPYLAHAAMEPINATARVREGHVELWIPTQVPGIARALAARTAGVPEEQVTVHIPLLGGAFGRRLDAEVVPQVVRIAMEMNGRPVQLLWPREEDFTHDFYRPAAAAVMRAWLDQAGQIQALHCCSASDAITPRWLERGLPALSTRIDMPDKMAAEGLFDLPYALPHQRIAHVATHSGVPVGYWRSVGHSQNAFFSECFVDELAAAAGHDAVAFRLGLLHDMPRHANVLRLAAEHAGWTTALPTGHARGVALHESFSAIVAQVVEVSMSNGRPQVHRVVCVADVGTVVNPGIVKQQLEGGIVFGLSAALYGRIDIRHSQVQQRNYPDYRLLKLADTPAMEIHLVPSTHDPAGVGEVSVPPVAPALCNALWALTGQRIRTLPVVS